MDAPSGLWWAAGGAASDPIWSLQRWKTRQNLSQTLGEIISVRQTWWCQPQSSRPSGREGWCLHEKLDEQTINMCGAPYVFAVWFESLSLGICAATHTNPQKCTASALFFLHLLIYKDSSRSPRRHLSFTQVVPDFICQRKHGQAENAEKYNRLAFQESIKKNVI